MYTDDSGAITAILQGDRDRYEELVAKYKRMVYGIAWSHLGDRDLSEDVAQETFVTAFRHLGTLRKHDHFPGWLAQIARNICNTFGRKAQREKALAERWMLESDAAQAQEADRRSIEEQLRDAFAELPAIHREALTVFYLEEKSIRESAAVLGISETALKARLHRARIALREQLERRLDETLESLEPSPNFTRKVLSALPLMPSGALGGGGMAAVAGKCVASLGFVLWMVLGQAATMLAAMWWVTRSEIANIKDTPENQFRKAVIKHTAWIVGVATVATLAIIMPMLMRFDLRACVRVYCIVFIPLTWYRWRSLRVNTTPMMLGDAFMSASFWLAAVLFGFFGVSDQVLPIVTVINLVVIFLTSRNRPARADHDLFLRAATDGLGDVPDGEWSFHRRLEDTELRAFARFLGNQWLVSDYRMQRNAIRLIVNGPRGLFRSPGSDITITFDGQCTARLGHYDLGLIRKLTGLNPVAEDLQAAVCRAVRYALRCFIRRELDAARSVLTARSDDTVFKKKPTGWSVAFTVIYALAIGMMLYAMLRGR